VSPVVIDRLHQFIAALPGRRDTALAVVNGFFGDRLADQASSLATAMTLRSGSEALTLDRHSLAGAFPQATGRVALLVHGLMANESVWGFPDEPETTYGSLLARDHGVTPLFLRYNSGRHVSINGRELAGVLDQLMTAWPVRVSDVTLIGHSMGGLVIRSACHYAVTVRSRLQRSWSSKTRRVVLIGVPNTGAPLEVFVNVTSAALGSLPVPATQLVSLGLDARSAGIRDLRFGAVTDEDWLDQNSLQRPVPHSVTWPRRAAYLIVAGGVTADPAHPLARLFGDTLVTTSSASGIQSGTTANELFPGSTFRYFPNVTHLALAHRRDVYEEINQWWS
jgi:pimeloyl-ACP methyl ester carboxylesterase